MQQPLSASMLAAAPTITLAAAEPQFRELIEVVQNATGLVATGEATPEQAITRYGDQLTQTMGKANVVSQPAHDCRSGKLAGNRSEYRAAVKETRASSDRISWPLRRPRFCCRLFSSSRRSG